MLNLNFHIETSGLSQRSLTIWDTTGDYDQVNNPGGYGNPNISRSDVSFAIFRVGWPDGNSSALNVQFKPTGYPLKLSAAAYALQVSSMATDYAMGPPSDTPAFVDRFPDGVYEVTYEIWGGVLPVGFLANYSASGQFVPGGKLYAMIQGGWYDVTSQADYQLSTIGERIGFSLLYSGVAVDYSRWQVRNSDDELVFSGMFSVEQLGISSVSSFSNTSSYLMGASSKSFVLVNRTLEAMDEVSTRLLNMDDTDQNVQLKMNRAALVLSQIDILKVEPSRKRAARVFPWVNRLIPCIEC